jgi:hypothetical protein
VPSTAGTTWAMFTALDFDPFQLLGGGKRAQTVLGA